MAKLVSYETGPRSFPHPDTKKQDTLVMPGVNDIDPEVMDAFKDHPVIKYLLKQGEKGGLVYDPKTALKTLASVKSVKGCGEIIEETFNLELLKQWLEAEERPQVQRLIEAHLEDLKKPDKKDESGKE